jgi:retinol dehydrogenase-14
MLNLPDLSGQRIVVTGATNGLGLESAIALARAGADVAIVGRDAGRTEAAAARIRATAKGKVDTHLCDFSSQTSIRALGAELRERYATIDVLVNNAGLVNDTRTETVDGIETTFAVNHLGYYLLTRLVLDRVSRRIVIVASRGHVRATMDFDDLGFKNGGYSIMGAYGRSKLGNILFARALARRLDGTGVTVNALHPGGVATNIWTGAPGWAAPILWLAKKFMDTPEQGGETISYLAASPEVEGKTGLYFSKHRPVTPSDLARDDALGERLWVESAKLTGMEP